MLLHVIGLVWIWFNFRWYAVVIFRIVYVYKRNQRRTQWTREIRTQYRQYNTIKCITVIQTNNVRRVWYFHPNDNVVCRENGVFSARFTFKTDEEKSPNVIDRFRNGCSSSARVLLVTKFERSCCVPRVVHRQRSGSSAIVKPCFGTVRFTGGGWKDIDSERKQISSTTVVDGTPVAAAVNEANARRWRTRGGPLENGKPTLAKENAHPKQPY